MIVQERTEENHLLGFVESCLIFISSARLGIGRENQKIAACNRRKISNCSPKLKKCAAHDNVCLLCTQLKKGEKRLNKRTWILCSMQKNFPIYVLAIKNIMRCGKTRVGTSVKMHFSLHSTHLVRPHKWNIFISFNLFSRFSVKKETRKMQVGCFLCYGTTFFDAVCALNNKMLWGSGISGRNTVRNLKRTRFSI